MKSTGEVMGSDDTVEKALYKVFEAANLHVPEYGKILITVPMTPSQRHFSWLVASIGLGSSSWERWVLLASLTRAV